MKTNWEAIKQKKDELYSALPSSIVEEYGGKSGIYQITINGHLAYVGKSTDLLNRWIAHKINTLYDYNQKDYREDKYLIFRNAYKANYTITCSVIEECDVADLSTRERYWINSLNPPLNGGGMGVYFKGIELLDLCKTA